MSDVFVAVVKMLRGEGEYLPGAAYGFLSRPVGVADVIPVAASIFEKSRLVKFIVSPPCGFV